MGVAEVGGAEQPLHRQGDILRHLLAPAVTLGEVIHRIGVTRRGADL
jgi:hypothetical protein